MKKLLFKIQNNTLIVKERIKLSNEYKEILNTNVISCNELIFSTDYLLQNQKIVSSFINELTNDYNIDTISIEKFDYAKIILNLIKSNKQINNLILKEENQLTFTLCELIAKTNIKNVNCYNLQPFMIEYLDKYHILIESRNEILYLSNFMLQNNLSVFSSLFYKMTLQIDLPMNNQDTEDFFAFCRINKYLKTINVTSVNKNDLEFIVNTLRKCNKKNIRIIIHDNVNDEDVINYLKAFNKKKSKKYKIYFKLEYSNEYINNNILKQTNNSILTTCCYIILLIIIFSFVYVFYDNYSSMKNVTKIQDKLNEVISINGSDAIIDEVTNKTNSQRKIINEDVAGAYNINPEVVAWVKVNNTNIDYPVVQTTNNSYYLKHNINFEEDKNGWVFMDYRSDSNVISDNVILYAHNRYYSGVMFGTLQNAMRYNWYTNPDNQIITLKTLYETLHYKIFSVYKVKTTLDYLKVIFSDNDEKMEMFNTIKNRSIYDFNVDLDENDKILTLSTCADEYSKYVVHAVLLED